MVRATCTEPQCMYNGALYLYLYLYFPYGPYGLYRASVPVQRCTLPLPIPVLPLWSVRPVQSLSACTTVHFTFTHTCTSPMVRTACTEPQCLYNGALYLYLYLRIQSKILRMVLNAPRYVSNKTLHEISGIQFAEDETKRITSKYLQNLSDHSNKQISQLQPPRKKTKPPMAHRCTTLKKVSPISKKCNQLSENCHWAAPPLTLQALKQFTYSCSGADCKFP